MAYHSKNSKNKSRVARLAPYRYMTNHLTGGPPVSSTHIAGLVCALNNKSSDSRAAILSSCAPFWTAPLGKSVQNSPPR
eukprot:scaffold1116_cov66-Phaeocystis_antarctica.AAC.2